MVASVHSKLRDGRGRDDPTDGAGGRRAPTSTSSATAPAARSWARRARRRSFDADLVFAACAQFDTAVEINCRPERQDPPDELLELALGWGCLVSIDTDAHAPGQLEWQPSGCDKAARHGIEPDQIVNTMAADDLVSWAASHTRPDAARSESRIRSSRVAIRSATFDVGVGRVLPDQRPRPQVPVGHRRRLARRAAKTRAWR